jgi:hypothetical protein
VLLIIGVLGFAADIYQWRKGIEIPEEVKNRMRQELQVEPPTEESLEKAMLGFGIVSAIVILGSIQMLRARMYPLAIIASVLAMVDCANGCCCLGLPVGIWSLIVLLRSDVRSLFYSSGALDPTHFV